VPKPVGQQEGIIFVEVAVVENQQEFAAVRVEPLDGMRDTARKIPEIADADVINEGVPWGSMAVIRALP
jgi:hypothetical protein